MADPTNYDVVIVGAGVSGSIIALQLATAGKRVLIIEAGVAVPANRNEYLTNFYLNPDKVPESPYPPVPLNSNLDPGHQATPRATILGLMNSTDPNKSYLIQPAPSPTHSPDVLPFGSTYERIAGGTTWHWLGTSLRLVPNDLQMYTKYGVFGPAADWPIDYDELANLYGQAEHEIGVSASVAQQAPLEAAIGLKYPPGYQYPLNPIPLSLVDQAVVSGVKGMTVDGKPVFVSPTPAGRNSQPNGKRPTCAGNTNCIPICPIQAKWDAAITLNKALDAGPGKVTVVAQAVARKVLVGSDGRIAGIEYVTWDKQNNPTPGAPQVARGTNYVLAAHAIENVKLLLMSASNSLPNGVANGSDQVGRNLMDHTIYLSWALMPEGRAVFPYRGPLSTSGIESLRDGPFRSSRSAYRIEIGNEGWNFPIGDPYVTVLDFINGSNNSMLNPITPPGTKPGASLRLGGTALALAVNDRLTRQFRLGCLVEQAPQASNQVTLDRTHTDGLGFPRPKISYGLDEYTLRGFASARQTCSAIYKSMGATEFTDYTGKTYLAGYFEYNGESYASFGAGHLMGTHRMGNDRTTSVVDANQHSHDHANLWIVGSGSFPSCATPNPTLTIAALAFKTAASVLAAL
jgi:glucose dehydrogenase